MTTELASATELKRGLYVKMAVGSNVENESNPTVRPQSTFHKQDGENCYGLPYEDHNYGASPLTLSSRTFIPCQVNGENCFNKIVSNSSNMCVTPSTSIKSHFVEPNLNHQNGLLKVDDLPLRRMIFPNNNVPLDSNAMIGDVTRCICGFKHDDGYMISCDRCRVWQHIDCVNIDRNHIPDTYLCDICNPRPLKKEEAIRLQAKKMKELSMMCDLNSSDVDSGDEKDPKNVTYTAVQSTPTSLTITSNRSSTKKRKRSKDDNRRSGKKAHTQDRKRSRSTSKSSCTDSVDDDHTGTFTWARKLKEWTDSYSPIDENLYTAELLQAVLSSSYKPNESAQQESVLTQLHKQLIKIQQLRNRIIAMEDIPVFTPVVEVLGSYMLSKQTEAANSGVQKRPYPYVFFYNGFDGLDIVVDSRTSGNISRYARRSCCPNCEVRHITEDNKIHLFIYSKDNIPNGSEITIPFDFKYQNCLYDVECGCGRFKDCPVYKFTNMRMEREQANVTKQGKNRDDEFGKVSPLRLPLSRIHEHTNGYTSTDAEGSLPAGGNDDEHQQENQRKKSREDRKMEAYIRAFERMEKQKKKKEQLHHSASYEGKNDVSTSIDNAVVNTSQTTTTAHSAAAPSDEASATSTTVTPQRRINRRRSTKTGRRNSRRGRGASFEGVMSPTLFIENDSSHSFESSSLLDPPSLNADSLQWLPPLTIEPSVESNLLMDTSLVNDQPDISSSTNLLNPDASAGPADLTASKEGLELMNPHADDSGGVIKDSSPALPLDTNEANKTEQLTEDVSREPEITAAENNHQPSESPVPETQQSSGINSKPGKKKQTNSIETTSATASKCEAASNPVLLPPRDFVNCSFKHWDYRPGVPNGQVHIGVRPRKARKYFTSVYIKKNWLDMAKHEDLIPNNFPSAPEKIIGFKKRLLHTFSAPSTLSLSASSDTSSAKVNESLTKPESPASSATVAGQDLSPASAEAPLQAQQTESPQLAVDAANVCGTENDVAPSDTDVHLGVVDHAFSAEGAEPPTAIDYENISDDEASSVNSDSPMETLIEEISKASPQQESWTGVTVPRLNGEMNLFTGSHPALQTALKPECDDASKPVSSSSTMEDSKNAPAKKKVSLQEYWKRSKGSRNNSVEQTTTQANAKVSACTTNSSSHLATVQPAPVTTASVSPNPSMVATSTNVTSLVSSNRPKEEATDTRETENVTSASQLADLTNNEVLSETARKIFTPELLKVLDRAKKLPIFSSDSLKKDVGDTSTKPVHAEPRRISAVEKGVAKPSPGRTESYNNSPILRPHVERSFSSPNIRQNFVSQSGSSTAAPLSSKRSAVSQQNSPTAHQTASNSAGSSTKGFASPVSVSPRSSRGHSTSFASQSPTPVPYKNRHRSDHGSTEGPSVEQTRSRHGSSASSGSNSTPSNRSPKQPNTEGSVPPHSSSKHSSGNQCLAQSNQPNGPHSQDLPQKVQSLTPAVPGQPIPSLMRGPGGGRVPQVVYNRRPSPRMDGGSPHWDPQVPRESSARSLKDIPYTKQDAYYHPQRPPSPLPHPHPDYDRDRNAPDQHYYDRDRYLHRPLRREDSHPPPGANPPSSYYHQFYNPPGYRGDRSGYLPSRSSRPSSPVPPPRHNPEYYSKTNNHRPSNYYPQDIHRR